MMCSNEQLILILELGYHINMYTPGGITTCCCPDVCAKLGFDFLAVLRPLSGYWIGQVVAPFCEPKISQAEAQRALCLSSCQRLKQRYVRTSTGSVHDIRILFFGHVLAKADLEIQAGI